MIQLCKKTLGRGTWPSQHLGVPITRGQLVTLEPLWPTQPGGALAVIDIASNTFLLLSIVISWRQTLGLSWGEAGHCFTTLFIQRVEGSWSWYHTHPSVFSGDGVGRDDLRARWLVDEHACVWTTQPALGEPQPAFNFGLNHSSICLPPRTYLQGVKKTKAFICWIHLFFFLKKW